VNPTVYNKGMVSSFKTVLKEEGAAGLFLGFSPTAIGYFLQGAFKFGVFEATKEYTMKAIGKDRIMNGDLKYLQFPIYMASSALGEAVASAFLCPWEAIRIRMVNNPTTYGKMNVFAGLQMIASQEGIYGGFFRGLVPILAKQVPYTMTQLTVFSFAADYFYRSLLPSYGKSKNDLNTTQQLSVSITCGVLAGLASAVASHPADTLLSLINKSKEKQTLSGIMKQVGFRGLWLGLGPRCFMVSLLSAGMFLVYDGVKVAVGLPTTGGK